ncbi:MAG: alanine racemase [Roseiarcus sp.]
MTASLLPGAPGVLTIDLGALADNWRLLARRAAPGKCAAVIKADGYGLGIEIVAQALYSAGCRTFFVAHLSEGRRARAVLPQADARLYVLNGLQRGADPQADYAAFGLAPAIGSAEELARWAAFAATQAAPPPCALHIDTGMNRLGFASLAELHAATARCGGTAGADLLMSHFASSEEPGNPLNAVQIARFEEAHAAYRSLAASLANSSGLFLPARPIFDLARPGYALYGGNPTPGRANPMKPVVTLDIAIQQTRWIEAGEACGYNGQWTARRRTRLATLLAGYADGLPRGAGAVDGREGAEVVVAGRRCKLVGRMSMDLCIADVTDVPEDAARPGDLAQLLGEEIGVDEFAARSGTIGYTVLTSLGARYGRRVVDA